MTSRYGSHSSRFEAPVTRRAMPQRIGACRYAPTNSRKTTKAHRGRPRAGRRSVRRGEIRWYTFAAPDKRRPVLLLTRTSVIDTLNEIIEDRKSVVEGRV